LLSATGGGHVMSVARNASYGIATVAAGLLLAGPQAAGVAAADSSGTHSAHSAADTHGTGGPKGKPSPQSGRNAKPANSNAPTAIARRVRREAAHPSTVAAGTPSVAVAPPSAASVPAATTHVAALTVPVMTSAKGLLPSIAGFVSNVLAKLRAMVEGAVLWVRRTFFDAAPDVNAVQTTGETSGSITGNLNITSAVRNKTTATILQSPQNGTVVLNSDNTYTYNPGSTFTGQDSFIIKVTEAGTHIDLTDPLRPAAVYVNVVVHQGTQIYPTFTFKYTTGSVFWGSGDSEAKAALQWSATQLASAISVTTPTTITLAVRGRVGFDESGDKYDSLASASSPRVNTSDPGFYGTVVRQKIIASTDANGSQADGTVIFNFAEPWGYGDTISSKRFDFESVAMHELLHSMGWTDGLEAAGGNTDTNWTTYDQFITNSTGVAAVNSTYKFNTALNPNLTGGNGGLYFNGPNAVEAYGGPVPVYTPAKFDGSSSIAHTDDNTFNGKTQPRDLMNARDPHGLATRTLSAVDLGVLKDLGYTLVSALVDA
jgi:hypothetical protein